MLCNDFELNQGSFFQENYFGSMNDNLNGLSISLNQEVLESSYELQSDSFDNTPRDEEGSVYANPEEEELSDNTLDTAENLEPTDWISRKVKEEIEKTDLDLLVEECCKSKEVKDPVKNSEKMRFKTTKTPLQIQRLQESLVKYPTRFPKKERKKLAEEIGLEEVQVYKWYYDNKKEKAPKRTRKST